MSPRAEILALIRSLPDGDPLRRVAMATAYLDGLPPEKAAAAERRMLALTQVYLAAMEGDPDARSGDFLAMVDAAERRLLN
ncbi:hypothetical protein DJ019_02410 [Phenylobacterium kunshanense]|uniref:Uncharacterized protein n=1 Tax=Phenylobacterium kunshanense TaxID=1445034 RepID=A0A328BPB6_9CAUL|nr:hypothetical protein DJ019_02410 [Phenylobacterium kunshanense]